MITFSHVAATVGASVFMFGVFAACSYRPAPAPDVVTPPRAIVNTEEPAPRERHQAKFTPTSPGATAKPDNASTKLDQADDALRWLRDTTLTKRSAPRL